MRTLNSLAREQLPAIAMDSELNKQLPSPGTEAGKRPGTPPIKICDLITYMLPWEALTDGWRIRSNLIRSNLSN